MNDKPAWYAVLTQRSAKKKPTTARTETASRATGGSTELGRVHLCCCYILCVDVLGVPATREGERELRENGTKELPKKYGSVGFSELVLSVRTKKRFYLENNHISAPRAPMDPGVVALNAHSHGAGGTAVRGGSDRLQGLKILQIRSSAREQPAGNPREIRNNHPPSRRCCENTPRGAEMNLLLGKTEDG